VVKLGICRTELIMFQLIVHTKHCYCLSWMRVAVFLQCNAFNIIVSVFLNIIYQYFICYLNWCLLITDLLVMHLTTRIGVTELLEISHC